MTSSILSALEIWNRGLLDELVPPEHSMKLLAAANKARFTETHVVEDGGHNVSSCLSLETFAVLHMYLTHSLSEHKDTWWQGGTAYRDAIKEFLRRIERGD